MTLEGAINLNETNDYIIYTMNSVTTGQYGVVVPKNINGTLKMLIDLHMKGSFDGVGTGVKTKEQLVSEIGEEYSKLKTKYECGMLVMPMIDEVSFSNIVNNGDKQKMFDEVKKIGAITSELYKKLTDSGIDKQKIDQKIIVIEKKDEDIKFVNWLKEQMPNFVDGVLYSELNGTGGNVNPNPFMNNNSIFGPAPAEVAPKVEGPVVASAPVSPVSGGIFDNVPPVVPTVAPVTNTLVEAVTSNAVVESVAPSVPVENTVASNPIPDIFGGSTSNEAPVPPVVEIPVQPVTEAPVPPVVEAPVNQPSNNGVFGTPVGNIGVQNTSPVNVGVENAISNNGAKVVAPVASIVEGPKPVVSSSIDGNMTFTAVAEQTNNIAENNGETGEDTGNKSKGFVNLAILLVVLVGITFLSIQIGKYLYSVYGA